MYVLSKNILKIKNFVMDFSFFLLKKILCIFLHGQVFVMSKGFDTGKMISRRDYHSEKKKNGDNASKRIRN